MNTHPDSNRFSAATRFLFSLAFVVFTSTLFAAEQESSQQIKFNREVQPILANACYACHGPDDEQREAEFRLDREMDALADRGGYAAIVPGSPEESELIRRITSSDPDEVMPPAESKKRITPHQIETLKKWIEQGAEWESHWSFRPITRPPLPTPVNSRHPIDCFISRQLEINGLQAVGRADAATLVRRVYLDLIGLLPTPEQIDAFSNDKSPDAFERLVDQLLANPHYGERWGRHWLDQARYADSDGYAIDGARVMWPYRDWVIQAINHDMPFDQFTIEQLAGDQVESPTTQQLVATGFHRNTLVNQEGGSDPEQFRNETVVDRVNTTGAVWLGLTVGCAQCHSHKFDPITQTEYYQLFAFFNSTQDKNSHEPRIVPIPSELEPTRDGILAAIQAAKNAIPQQQGDSATSELRQSLQEVVKRLEASQRRFEDRFGSVMIMRQLEEPRKTHVHIRGDFLRRGDGVEPNVPAVLPPLLAKDGQYNRLDLARWLVDARNPLTARVTVNRVWMRLFGQGLVVTENDFGTQGTPPTHPRLLNWLASRFIEDGWSLKRLHRLIVLSDAYQRSSLGPPGLAVTDPRNRLLARQSRLRVDAEIVRDLALSASGLLSPLIGGPSVYPPQPEGVYAFTQRKLSWETSHGADRFRRGMYTFFYRSAPHPLLTTFDSPNFQTVCTRRVRSNTPLQSLTMANDQSMLDLAQGLAMRILRQDQRTDQQRIVRAFRICLGRAPDAHELTRLSEFLARQLESFSRDQAATAEFTKSLTITDLDPSQVAAWTSLARILMNLDEFITRG